MPCDPYTPESAGGLEKSSFRLVSTAMTGATAATVGSGVPLCGATTDRWWA